MHATHGGKPKLSHKNMADDIAAYGKSMVAIIKKLHPQTQSILKKTIEYNETRSEKQRTAKQRKQSHRIETKLKKNRTMIIFCLQNRDLETHKINKTVKQRERNRQRNKERYAEQKNRIRVQERNGETQKKGKQITEKEKDKVQLADYRIYLRFEKTEVIGDMPPTRDELFTKDGQARDDRGVGER